MQVQVFIGNAGDDDLTSTEAAVVAKLLAKPTTFGASV
jgi:hypothetical protein